MQTQEVQFQEESDDTFYLVICERRGRGDVRPRERGVGGVRLKKTFPTVILVSGAE